MATKASAKNIDFSNVREVGNFNTKRVAAGDYLAEVTKVEDAVSKKDDAFQYLFTIKLKKFSQNAYPYYCKLQENQLWKLRNLLIAAGLNVPKKKIKLDPNRVIGKTIGVTMEDDEYEGREKSTIAAVFPAAELADGFEADEDEPEAEEEEANEADDSMDDLEEEPETEEAEEEEDEADEEEEEEASPYADYDRTKLKREIKKLKADYSIKRSQSDDDLRAVLAELAGSGSSNDGDDEDDELEELDLDNL